MKYSPSVLRLAFAAAFLGSTALMAIPMETERGQGEKPEDPRYHSFREERDGRAATVGVDRSAMRGSLEGVQEEDENNSFEQFQETDMAASDTDIENIMLSNESFKLVLSDQQRVRDYLSERGGFLNLLERTTNQTALKMLGRYVDSMRDAFVQARKVNAADRPVALKEVIRESEGKAAFVHNYVEGLMESNEVFLQEVCNSLQKTDENSENADSCLRSLFNFFSSEL